MRMLPHNLDSAAENCSQLATDLAGTSTDSDAGTREVDESGDEDERCGPEGDYSEDDVKDERGGTEVSGGEEDERGGPELRDFDESEDTEDGDSDESDVDKNLESEERDHEIPAKKRVKTSHSSLSRNICKKNSLSLLPTMPLDIQFEVFSHLFPKDILSLSRTSKVFHKTLSSRNTVAVWKAARERVSAPDCPDWMSEEAWAELLFGNNCQSCGLSTTPRILDFDLLKRICDLCHNNHLVSCSEVERCYPNFNFVILLVPSIKRHSVYYYWNFDIEAVVSKLITLRKDDDAQQLNCFMDERKRRLEYMRQNSLSWRKWYHQVLKDRALKTREAEKRCLQQIKEKFKELGYIEEDLYILHARRECYGWAQLSTKTWNRIYPILEPEIKSTRAYRLEREFAAIKSKRRQVLVARYKDYQRTLHPSQWKYSPSVLEIVAFEPFSRHIEADVGVEVDGKTFDDAFLEFPNILAAATDQRKAVMRPLIGDIARDDGEIGADPIDLASAVFKCVEAPKTPHFKYIFGWDEIASHQCLHKMEFKRHNPEFPPRTAPQLIYIPEIANAVGKLAQLVGLDAATTTASDFDRIDKRFSCDACPCFSEHDQFLRVGYTWRNLAVHLGKSKSHNPDLNITVLSDIAENEIKQCERKDRKWNSAQWTCSHCPEYLDNPQERQSIVQHLFDSHGIQTPSEPTDYFFFERYRREWVGKPKFSVPGEKKNSGGVQCLLCSRWTSSRQFTPKGVKDHLRTKHCILSGKNGKHYGPV